MADYDSFSAGGVAFPLATSTANSLLRDADPPIFYALEYLSAVLERYIAPRLLAQAATQRLNLPRAVVQTISVKPTPNLFADQFRFPALAIYRTDETFADKTVGLGGLQSEWEWAYILPPLQPGPLKEIHPILRAVAAVMYHAVDQGHDPAYDDDVNVWSRAGVAGIRVMDAKYGGYQPIDDQPEFYRAVVGTIRAFELGVPGGDSLEPFEGVRVHVDVASKTEPTLQDVVEFDSHPVIANVIPNFGPAAGGTAVVLKGAGFDAATTVFFGTTPATGVTFVDQNTLTCTSPAGTGIVDLRVVSGDGRPGRKLMAFTYS